MASNAAPTETTSLRQELMSESYRRRNWKGIAVGVLVICATVAIIVVTVLYTSRDYSNDATTGTLHFDNVTSGYYSASSFNGTFVSAKEIAYTDHHGNFVLLNLQDQNTTFIVSNGTISEYGVSRLILSPTKGYVLLICNFTKVFRHTFTAIYKIYTVATGDVSDINSEVGSTRLQYANWSPAGNQLVYVLDNNVYYMKNVKDLPQNLSSDGEPGVIYNGVPDWVYEEEVLASSNALWWSPDGKLLCFAQFNDTLVEKMSYVWYGSYQDINNVYTQVRTIRYPKPGRPNPTVDLYVVNPSSPDKKVRVQPPDDVYGEYYFTALSWIDDETLLVVWVPRIQVNASVSVCSAAANWKCTENTLFSSKGWVDFSKPLVSNKDYYFLLLPQAGNFKHLSKISLKDSNETFLTSGNFEVTDVKAVANNQVYYIRTGESQPNVRHFASVALSGNESETCYTCRLYGDNCTYNSVLMGPENKYYVWICAGPAVPMVTVRSLPDNDLVMTWTSNERLKKRLEGEVLPKVKTLRVPVSGGYEAIVKLYLPADFNENKKYPILVYVYGGPASQMNTDAFGVDWGSYLATVKKYIYAEIDGRGSGFRGDKLLFEIYKRMGTVEIEDQISVVRYLVKNERYVDGSRAGIWGWSYGGYAAAMSLATGKDTFKCAASVAPVTSWYYYDSVYTERYMQRPQDNGDAYKSSILMNHAKDFKNKKFLLIHGTADDNVHLQQSMMLSEALSSEGVVFNSRLYPDQDHGIPLYTNNVYRTLQQFFDDCFR